MTRPLLIICLSFITATLVGCASLQTPTAKVTDVAVTGQTDVGASVRLTVKLHNPNDFVLPLTRAHYTIDVAGLDSFSFNQIPDCALPAHGDQTLQFTAGFPLKNQSIDGRTYRVNGYASIQPPGKMWQIFHQSGMPLPTSDFSATGKFPAGQ